MKTFVYLIMSVGLVLVAACASPQTSVAEYPSPTNKPLSSLTSVPPTQGDNTMKPLPLAPSASSPEGQVEKAKQDLAQRLGISVDSVTVLAIIGQEFSTDAFNCQTSKERISKEEPPQDVSGQSILLSALGRRYEYHASDQTVIFCRPLP